MKTKFLLPALFLLLLLGLLSSATSIPAESIDAKLYKLLHDSYRSPTMDVVMKTATHLGSSESGLCLCLMFSTYGNDYQKQTAKLAFASMAVTAIVAQTLKVSVNRRRPEATCSNFNSSFPSGHATGSFAMATILANRYSRYRVVSYAAASIVGLSRIYLGRHYPSDVLAGALLGYVGSRLVLHFKDEILSIEF